MNDQADVTDYEHIYVSVDWDDGLGQGLHPGIIMGTERMGGFHALEFVFDRGCATR